MLTDWSWARPVQHSHIAFNYFTKKDPRSTRKEHECLAHRRNCVISPQSRQLVANLSLHTAIALLILDGVGLGLLLCLWIRPMIKIYVRDFYSITDGNTMVYELRSVPYVGESLMVFEGAGAERDLSTLRGVSCLRYYPQIMHRSSRSNITIKVTRSRSPILIGLLLAKNPNEGPTKHSQTYRYRMSAWPRANASGSSVGVIVADTNIAN